MNATELPTNAAASPDSPNAAGAAEAPLVEQASRTTAARFVKRAKILIVDDEPSIIKTVERHLRSLGCGNIIHTTASTQALDLIRSEAPDLVLLDIGMPEIDGLQLLRQIRSVWQSHQLPVIMLTASCDSATRRRALELGATDFLGKPVDPHELAARVRNTLLFKAHQDELTERAERLQREVRQQAEALLAARHEAELRYIAGKAEIATDVLHNVGNALNSVNVGVNLIALTVRESRIGSLRRAVDLMQEHEKNLTRFLTKDQRGRLLPSYLVELTDALMNERLRLNNEIEMVSKHLEHINAVVATQQKYATLCSFVEDVQVTELLQDVEELLGGSMARHGVELICRYDTLPPVKTDKQKLMQVLLNVMRNALDSMKEANRTGMGRLEIEIGRLDESRAVIRMIDNGVGIPPENLTKIFAHGFTTKRDGHGFGLHSCANIMKELGGSMRAESDGPGRGASFTIELPFERKKQRT